MSALDRVMHRKEGPLPPARAARRMSAYVYGNVLVLAAVVAATSDAIEDGKAVLIVLGTTVSTYLAHIYSEALAHGVTDTGEPEHFSEELRDAVPILSSGGVPIVALLACWLDLLPAGVSQIIAGGVIVVRLASVGVWVERLHGNRPSWRMITIGLVSAAFCAVIVFIKVFFVGH
jgi:hypothetical protein